MSEQLRQQLITGHNLAAQEVAMSKEIDQLKSQLNSKVELPRLTRKGFKVIWILGGLLFLHQGWKIYAYISAYNQAHSEWKQLVNLDFQLASRPGRSEEEAWEIAYRGHPEPQHPFSMFGLNPNVWTALAIAAVLIVTAILVVTITYTVFRTRISDFIFRPINIVFSRKNKPLHREIKSKENQRSLLQSQYERNGLPVHYADPEALRAMVHYVEAGRAQTFDAAANIYEQEKHNIRLRQAERHRLDEMNRQMSQLRRNQEIDNFFTRQAIDDLRYR